MTTLPIPRQISTDPGGDTAGQGEGGRSMTPGDPYFLGYRRAEQERLQRQASELADDSERLFEKAGVGRGDRVVEIGCGPEGCLALLSDRVGLDGSVIGVERNHTAAVLARSLVAAKGLENVEILEEDGRQTGLTRGAHDAVVARLVLINIPNPCEVLEEAVSLLRPGGTALLHEAVWPAHICEPACPAWDRLHQLVIALAQLNGTDLHIGLRLPHLLREQGITDIEIIPLVHEYPIGHSRRMLGLDLIENLTDGLLAHKLVGVEELTELTGEVRKHLEDPDTLVVSGLHIQAWGHTAD